MTSWRGRGSRAVLHVFVAAVAFGSLVIASGCEPTSMGADGSEAIPSPIDKTLPHQIRIHPHTGGPRSLDGETMGLEVQVVAVDAFGDNTKAFGEFRVELFQFRPNSQDPKGNRLAVWEVSVFNPSDNKRHWDKFRQMYEFRLQWDRSVAPGQKLVLRAVFSSPFTERLFDQHVFIVD